MGMHIKPEAIPQTIFCHLIQSPDDQHWEYSVWKSQNKNSKGSFNRTGYSNIFSFILAEWYFIGVGKYQYNGYSSLFQVVLVVNVASACGYTDGHYKALVKLHNRLSPGGRFTVLAFPCNQFGMQEPMVHFADISFNYKCSTGIS